MRSSSINTGQADGSSVGLDLRRPDRPARGRGASRHLLIASGPATSFPAMVAALACGGRCVCAGRRNSQSAAVDSSPRTVGVGLAVFTSIRRGAAPLSVQPAARLVAVSSGRMPRGGAISPRRRRAPFDRELYR